MKEMYKEIARIIKKERDYLEEQRMSNKIAYALHSNRYLSVALANHFEIKESVTCHDYDKNKPPPFNRQHFLKMCGVEE